MQNLDELADNLDVDDFTATAAAKREKLVKIGAKVVSHARYVTFQMAKVLVSKSLFHQILDKIHRLKPYLHDISEGHLHS